MQRAHPARGRARAHYAGRATARVGIPSPYNVHRNGGSPAPEPPRARYARVPLRALAPYSLPLVARGILRGTLAFLPRRMGEQLVPRCSPMLLGGSLALCLP